MRLFPCFFVAALFLNPNQAVLGQTTPNKLVLGTPKPGTFDTLSNLAKLSRIRREKAGKPMDDAPTHNWDAILEYDQNLRAAYFAIANSQPAILTSKDRRWNVYNDASIVDAECENNSETARLRDYPALSKQYCEGPAGQTARAAIMKPFH